MATVEKDPKDKLSLAALSFKKAVIDVLTTAGSEFAQSSWAIVARNGHVCVVRGNGFELGSIDVFLRPEIPESAEKNPVSFLKALGKPEEAGFYALPSEALASFPSDMVRSLAILPGAVQLQITYSESQGRATVKRRPFLADLRVQKDLASLLGEVHSLVISGSPKIYSLSSEQSPSVF